MAKCTGLASVLFRLADDSPSCVRIRSVSVRCRFRGALVWDERPCDGARIILAVDLPVDLYSVKVSLATMHDDRRVPGAIPPLIGYAAAHGGL